MIYSHYFICQECGCDFIIRTKNPTYSVILGTPDCMPVCPNCRSHNIYMNDVTEERV